MTDEIRQRIEWGMIVDSVISHVAGTKLELPFMQASVRAGFPSPADDYMEKAADLNDLLVKHPASTFYLRARGDSMEGAGICDGATLIVDRSLTPTDGDVVIAIVDGNLTVKRLKQDRSGAWLEAANPRYQPIALSGEDMIWGVVTSSINPMKRRA